MSLSDKRPTTRTERALLRRTFPGVDLRAYDRDRNDYANYTKGRTQVDLALEVAFRALPEQIDASKPQVYLPRLATGYSGDRDLPAAADDLLRMERELRFLADRCRDLAAVLGMRHSDADADADLDAIVAAIDATAVQA